MALGAGRKGLASELVDEFGYLKGEMPTGEYYTKSQTDNKFETKTHVSNTYQKKTLELPLETLMGSKLTVEDSLDALNEIQKTRQPKTLDVPIEMLSGSKLTVESALEGLNNDKVDNNAKVVQSVTHKGVVVSYTRHANIVMVSISGECTEEIANNEIISDVPVGFETTFSGYYNIICFNNIANPSSPILVEGIEGGVVKCNNVIHVGDKPRGTITYGI